jgi:hypothetical protein
MTNAWASVVVPNRSRRIVTAHSETLLRLTVFNVSLFAGIRLIHIIACGIGTQALGLAQRFHLYITRQVSAGWESHHYASTYRALLRNELTNAIQAAGFIDTRWMLPSETGFYQPILMAKAER